MPEEHAEVQQLRKEIRQELAQLHNSIERMGIKIEQVVSTQNRIELDLANTVHSLEQKATERLWEAEKRAMEERHKLELETTRSQNKLAIGLDRVSIRAAILWAIGIAMGSVLLGIILEKLLGVILPSTPH